jgi:hypothetical protein
VFGKKQPEVKSTTTVKIWTYLALLYDAKNYFPIFFEGFE